MSSSHQNAEHSPRPPSPQIPPSPTLPDLTALAEKLQETAQALLAVCQTPGTCSGQDEAKAPPKSAAKDKNSKPPYEIRSYKIPDYILRDEQDLLEENDAKDLPELLNRVYDHISCIVTLMKHFDQEEEISGFHLSKLAETLLLPLAWLEELCTLFVGFRPVPVSHMKTE